MPFRFYLCMYNLYTFVWERVWLAVDRLGKKLRGFVDECGANF